MGIVTNGASLGFAARYPGRLSENTDRSEKVAVADGSWQHTRIILEPLNQAHAPIELTAENREDFAVLGEFERVVRLT